MFSRGIFRWVGYSPEATLLVALIAAAVTVGVCRVVEYLATRRRRCDAERN